MTRLRRSFTAKFKLEAASLVVDQGYSVPEASRSLDAGETVFCRWVQQLQSKRSGSTSISKALTPEQQKIQELEARINRLEREKDILKKATALLMANGGSILVLQRILGHASIQQTMTYAHFAPDFLQDAVQFNPLRGGAG
ncbi:transposase [Aeromonas hydrophila]|nr:transposase [Aeromonas hydrophila]TNH87339.1 transposase [Aeromonas hydrophila]